MGQWLQRQFDFVVSVCTHQGPTPTPSEAVEPALNLVFAKSIQVLGAATHPVGDSCVGTGFLLFLGELKATACIVRDVDPARFVPAVFVKESSFAVVWVLAQVQCPCFCSFEEALGGSSTSTCARCVSRSGCGSHSVEFGLKPALHGRKDVRALADAIATGAVTLRVAGLFLRLLDLDALHRQLFVMALVLCLHSREVAFLQRCCGAAQLLNIAVDATVGGFSWVRQPIMDLCFPECIELCPSSGALHFFIPAFFCLAASCPQARMKFLIALLIICWAVHGAPLN